MAASSSAILKLDAKLNCLHAISDERASSFSKLGISCIRDLINYFPDAYVDLSAAKKISDYKIGDYCTIVANVEDIQIKEPKVGMKLVEIALSDSSDSLICTFFRAA